MGLDIKYIMWSAWTRRVLKLMKYITNIVCVTHQSTQTCTCSPSFDNCILMTHLYTLISLQER